MRDFMRQNYNFRQTGLENKKKHDNNPGGKRGV